MAEHIHAAAISDGGRITKLNSTTDRQTHLLSDANLLNIVHVLNILYILLNITRHYWAHFYVINLTSISAV